ncbi:MAG TPA: protein TolA, partial [Burkholderiales bacterium]
MSHAISADEPGGAAPAALSLLVHAVLFAVLVVSLHWQSKHPDAVVAELWSELPAIEPPEPKTEPKVEPKPEVKPPPRIEPKVEQKPLKPDIAVEREKKIEKKQKKEE